MIQTVLMTLFVYLLGLATGLVISIFTSRAVFQRGLQLGELRSEYKISERKEGGRDLQQSPSEDFNRYKIWRSEDFKKNKKRGGKNVRTNKK